MDNLLFESKLLKKLDNYGSDFKDRVLKETENQLDEISFAGLKNVGGVISDKFSDNVTKPIIGLKDRLKNTIKDNIGGTLSDIKQAYYNGNIEEIENEIIEILIASVNKINEKRLKSGQPPLNKSSIIASLANKANKKML